MQLPYFDVHLWCFWLSACTSCQGLLFLTILNLFLRLLHFTQSIDFLCIIGISILETFLFLLECSHFTVVISLPLIVELLIVFGVVCFPGTRGKFIIAGIGIVGCGLWRSVLLNFWGRGYAQRASDPPLGSYRGGRRLCSAWGENV